MIQEYNGNNFSLLFFRGRGQVSTEILFSAVILLFLFVLVLIFIEQTKQQAERAQENVVEQEICTKFSTIITYMSSNPPYTETTLELNEDANIIGGKIFVGDYFCSFLGKAANVQLYRGIVRAFDINGVVVFTNDLNYSPFNPLPPPPDVNGGVAGGLLLLIDDQTNQWVSEVQADDTSYAVSPDDLGVDPDWVEFRFANMGLTSANPITQVTFVAKHLESSQLGLGTGNKNMVQCYNGAGWVDINSYTPSFTELYYVSPNLVSCISDYNLANNARLRMTYEPNGVGDTISIDYGRLDIGFLQAGSVINLWEHTNDLPQPVDFRTDINSTANTFGSGQGNDGWDWNRLAYGGTIPSAILLNADPNFDGNSSDSTVGFVDRLEIKLGGGAIGAPPDPDDNATIGPVTSAAYGIQFDISPTQYSSIQTGSQLLLSFTYSIDADAGWGNTLEAGEEGWIKARFGNAGGMTYLGSNIDMNDNDADTTNEIWWAEQPSDSSAFFIQNIASLVTTGSGAYYLEIGGALSDWDNSKEGLGIYIDNVNLVVV